MAGLVLHSLFFASGAAGLIYEIVWVREFGTVFGSTVYSVALVTSLFMCGLGLGGYAAGRFADTRFQRDPRSPLRWYGVIEIAIGLLALGLAVGLPRLAPLAASIAHYVPGEDGFFHLALSGSLARYAVAAVLLAPITLLMGATLTLLIRYVVGNTVEAAGWRISLLYAANTAGAAFGCLLTDTLWVPAFGLLGAQSFAVGLNLVAGLGALALARAQRTDGPPAAAARPAERPTPQGAGSASQHVGLGAALTGFALAMSGFASMGMQVVWFRSLVSVQGAYRPVFSMLLVVILTGLWVGSLLGSAIERRLRQPLPVFAAFVALFALCTLGGLASFEAGLIEEMHGQLLSDPPTSDFTWAVAVHWMSVGPALLLVGLPIFFLGAAFPLANAYVQRYAPSVGRRAGALYLANTAGAVAGSLAGGFALLPALGMQQTSFVLVAAALLGVVALGIAEWRDAAPRERSRRRLAVVGASLALPLAALVSWARLPDDFVLRRSLSHLQQGELLALHEGVNETIAVMEFRNLARGLFTNGHSMSTTAPDAQRYMRSFSHIPLLIHEQPRRAMVMCFGVGNTLHASLLHPLEQVDLVDLSADVLAQAHWFEATNGGALRDPRVRVFVNDGRQHLRMTAPETYDLITGEPPPIAHAGVVALYTREFFALARSRLKPGGLISYWFPIRQVDEEAALSLVRGFVEVFPESVLLSGAGSELILLGRVGEAPRLEPDAVRRRLDALPEVAADLHQIQMGRMQELFGTFAASADTMRKASAGVRALTDDRPALEYGGVLYAREFSLPPALFDVSDAAVWCPTCLAPRVATPEDAPATYRVHLRLTAQLYAHPQFLKRRPGNLRRPQLRVPRGEIASAEVSRSLFLRSLLGLGPSEYQRALALVGEGKLEEATRLLEDVVILMPGHAPARVTLAEVYLSSGRAGDACREFDRALAIDPDPATARSRASTCGASRAGGPTS
jgi:predicted membrane-bound spermidine synthase